jgi:hypothetical protein
MEFSYKLTEDDFVRAGAIKVRYPSARAWSKSVSRIYSFSFLAALWLAFVSGRILERLDVTGNKLGDVAVEPLLLASILPSAILAVLIILVIRIVVYWPKRSLRREQYRNNAACQVETVVRISPESISFRSATGSSESRWTCYAGWNLRSGILVLANKAGVRQILKVAGLSPSERTELMQILDVAIPKHS